jgi:hypothetical protein
VQQDVTAPVIKTSEGDLIVFRLTDTDPTRAAVDLDEVRFAVQRDVSRLHAWNTLRSKLEGVQTEARQNGLLHIALLHGSTVSRPQPVSIVDAGVPVILDAATRQSLMTQSILARLGAGATVDELASVIPSLTQLDVSVVQAIIDRAGHLPLETPVADLSVEERVFVVPSEENMALVVVRVTGTTPTSIELAKGLSGASAPLLQTIMMFSELGGTKGVGEAFSLTNLTNRHNFKRGRAEVETDES